MSTIHNDVFAAFIEADKALKELPAIREELAKTQNNLEGASHELDARAQTIREHEEEIAKLRAFLAAREAELARATFRADAVEAKHRALRGILGSSDDSVVAVDGALTSAQITEEVVEANRKAGSVSADPTTPPVGLMENIGHSVQHLHVESSSIANTAPKSGQSDVDPTSPSPDMAMNGTSPEPHSENSTSALGPSSKDSAEPASRVLLSESASESASPTLAFTGRPHHSKPHGMEWGYWIVNGGEAPYWYDADFIRTLKDEYHQYVGHAAA